MHATRPQNTGAWQTQNLKLIYFVAVDIYSHLIKTRML